jgi:hypothetical protein
MSAIGPKQTWPGALHMSAFGGKADIGQAATLSQRRVLHFPGYFTLQGQGPWTFNITSFVYGHNADAGAVSYSLGLELPQGAYLIPLPAALPLFATGLGALGLLGWRRKRKASVAA